jgi:Zn-dependent metalloprotease
VTAASAVARARSGLGGALAATPSTRLVVLPTGRGVLAWLVTIRVDDGSAATGNWQAFVDAASGRLLSRYNEADTATGTGSSLYSGTVAIGTEQTATGFVMRDAARNGLETRDMLNKGGGAGAIFTDADNVWGTGPTPTGKAPASAPISAPPRHGTTTSTRSAVAASTATASH